MTVRDARRVVGRWRWIVVAGVVMGAVVGWLTAPGDTAVTAYQATHTLVLDSRIAGSQVNRVNEVLATLGPVPDRVAARLHVDSSLVRSSVKADTRTAGVMFIHARSADPVQAAALANVTAEELIVELGGKDSPLQTLEPAVASPVKSDDIKGPRSRPGRALLLSAFGLLLGLAAAFAVDRFDNRVQRTETAEEVLGVPVMARIGVIPRPARERLLTGAERSAVVEAYRDLRTGVVRAAAMGGDAAGSRVIVVTSATGGEGKTATVAHLAATLGEVGHTVVAISADLHRPRLHLYFDRPLEPGLSDLLRGAPDVRHLADLNLTTSVRNVGFVASGAPVRNPGPLIDGIGQCLQEARGLAEFVLIDSPPLLVASDAADLARQADAVLMVVRAGRTSIGAAARSGEVLQRLGVPVLGAVVVGGDSSRRGGR